MEEEFGNRNHRGGGIWDTSRKHLGGILETSGRHLGSIWKHLGRIQEASEEIWRHQRDIWDASGDLGGWEASGRHLGCICFGRPDGALEAQVIKNSWFFNLKWRERPIRMHGSDLTLTISAACAQKLASNLRARPPRTFTHSLLSRQNSYR